MAVLSGSLAMLQGREKLSRMIRNNQLTAEPGL